MKMRYFNILLIFLSACIHSAAQSADGNIYVYRNDGRFNAFFSAEVDSMGYSNTGLDGTRHDHPVVQEIYTADSTYRIPLAVIDSISVQKPETILAPGVKQLYPDYVPYIVGSDDMTIRFSTSLPYKMNIKKGDVLFYDRFDERFEDGFAGRVVSITNDGDLNVECEPVELHDVYQQFLGFGEAVIENPAAMRAPASKAPDNGVDIGVSATPIVRPLVSVKDGKTYIEVTLGIAYDFNASIRISQKCDKRFSLAKGDIPVGQPIPGVLFTVGFENYAELALSGGLEFGFYGGGNFSRTIVYDNGTWNLGQPKHSKDPISFDGSLSASGSVSVGVGLTVGIKVVGNVFVAQLIPSVGNSLEFEITKSFNDFDKHKFYDLFKESTLTRYNFAQLEIGWRYPFEKETVKHRIPVSGKAKFNTHKLYLLPEFADLDVKTDKGSMTVSTRASRQLLVPCKVGLAVLDEDGREVDSYMEDQSVYLFDVNLNKTFSTGLYGGTKYTVKPIVKLFGFDMYASPDEETYLDAEITTGPAFATTYSVRTSCGLGSKPSEDVEVGFVYSATNSEPTVFP